MLKLVRIDWYQYDWIWSYRGMFYDILRFLPTPLAIRPLSRIPENIIEFISNLFSMFWPVFEGLKGLNRIGDDSPYLIYIMVSPGIFQTEYRWGNIGRYKEI